MKVFVSHLLKYLLIALTAAFANGILMTLGVDNSLLISVVAGVLASPFISKFLDNEKRVYVKIIAVVVLLVGCVWSLFLVSSKNKAQNVAEKVDTRQMVSQLEYAIVEACRLFEQQAPVRVDDTTVLYAMTYSDKTWKYFYQVEVEKSALTDSQWQEILSESKEIDRQGTIEVFNMSQEDLSDLFKISGLKIVSVYCDIDKTEIGSVQIDYTDFVNE